MYHSITYFLYTITILRFIHSKYTDVAIYFTAYYFPLEEDSTISLWIQLLTDIWAVFNLSQSLGIQQSTFVCMFHCSCLLESSYK